jgi:ribosomal-protein-alanine N-acetyltransferase
MRHVANPAFGSPDMMEGFLDSVEHGYATGEYYDWAIALEGAGAVGICALHAFDGTERTAKIGYALARRCWRRGLMSEVLQELLPYCFHTLDLKRLIADVDDMNVASIRLLTGFGFVRNGGTQTYVLERERHAPLCPAAFHGERRLAAVA